MGKISNEQKAREIAENAKLPLSLNETDEVSRAVNTCSKKGYFKTAVKYGASVMAQWKDEQHKDIEEGLREIIKALDAKLQKANESGMYYFNQCNIQKQKLIDEACEWLAENDSYAIPTNVQVDRLRAFLKGEDSDYEKQYQEYKRKVREL